VPRQTVLHWFWLGPDQAARPVSWPVALLNWALAFLVVSTVCVFSFSQLRYHWDWETIGSYQGFFWRGWRSTLGISLLSLVFSTFIGLLTALARRSRLLVLRALSRLYVEVIRGTPLLVQISFAFYVVADAFHVQNRFVVGVATLSIFAGAFVGETIRGGIESVGASQLDSARAIGLTRRQTYLHVIFPQAIRAILPSLAGLFANLIKDSSLLSVISIEDFTWNAQQVAALTFNHFECYLILAGGYLVLTLPVTLGAQYLERRTKYET
jgi:polar amino acid transport system permease protein